MAPLAGVALFKHRLSIISMSTWLHSHLRLGLGPHAFGSILLASPAISLLEGSAALV